VSPTRRLRIFLSSPGDVYAERALVRDIIERELAKERLFRLGAKLDVITWDDPNASVPMDAHLTPQEAVNRALPQPSECDVVIVILWSRMGTPLSESFKKPDGTRYLSGTEYEYLNAATAVRKPRLLLYRCIAPVEQAWRFSKTAETNRQRKEQYTRVKSFFHRFMAEDGSQTGSFKTYETKARLRALVKLEVREILQELLLEGAYGRADLGIARIFRAQTAAFRDEYLISETGPVPFGGRDKELDILDRWLFDSNAAPRLLITAPAGRGKSALLVQWMKSLQELGIVAADRWQLAFLPISIRIGTNRPEVFYEALAQRLAEITGDPISIDVIRNAEYLRYAIRARLDHIAESGRRVLIVVDGLDEALTGSFDSSIIPSVLPPSLRIILSARWQVGDNGAHGWLTRLGWDRHVLFGSVELQELDAAGIADVVVKLGAPADVLARQPHIVSRLVELTEGEPILVRYYAEDLWHLRQAGASITIADLNSLKPGFGSYFERWFLYQEKLWVSEKANFDRNDIDQILSILAFAFGPLESRELLGLIAIISRTDGIVFEDRLLQPLRRFVQGSGKAGQGYVLNHPKIGDYLQRQRFSGHATKLRMAFVKWGQDHLQTLNSRQLAPQLASPYALQFLHKHFGEAQVASSGWMQLVEDGWREAWECFEGGPRGFSVDVQAAWDALRREGPVSKISAQWRCALVLSSIRSIGFNIPGALIFAAAKKGVVSIRQAGHFAVISRNNQEGAIALAQLARLSISNPGECYELISASIQKVNSISVEENRVRALETVSQLLLSTPDPDVNKSEENDTNADSWNHKSSPTEIPGALQEDARNLIRETAVNLRNVKLRIHALLFVAKATGPPRRAEVIATVLEAARNDPDKNSLSAVLTELAPYLLEDERSMELASGSIRESIHDPTARARILTSVVENLRAGERTAHVNELRDITIETFQLIAEPEKHEKLFAWIAPYLTGRQRRSMLNNEISRAKLITDPVGGAQVVARIYSYLSARERTKIAADIMNALDKLDNEEQKGAIIACLAAQLSKQQIASAFSIIKSFESEELQCRAIASISSHLSKGQISVSLVAAAGIKSEELRAQVIGCLARWLSEKQISFALMTARAFESEEHRARLIGVLAPFLSRTDIVVVLAMLNESESEEFRAKTIEGLSRYLSREQISDAFAIASQIRSEELRGRAIGGLASYLSEEELAEAIMIADAIHSEKSRRYLLRALLPFLSKERGTKALAAANVLHVAGNSKDTLELLAPYMPNEVVEDALSAAKAIKDIPERNKVLGILAPSLSSDQISDALAAAKSVGYEWYQRDAIRLLLSQSVSQDNQTVNLPLSPSQVADALRKIDRIKDDEEVAYALCALVPFVEPTEYAVLMDAFLRVVGRLPRQIAMQCMVTTRTMSISLGGPDTISDLGRAVDDVARWYP